MSGAPAPATGLDFDPARLRTYFDSRLPAVAGDLRIERVGGGQSNPTYFVTAGGTELVLRKRPVGELVPSAHDVAREFRILTALAGSDVPVPAAPLFCDDPEVIGTAFYVMQRLDGRVLHDATLDAVAPDQRRAHYLALARALAALHAVDWEAVGLSSLARAGSFVERQVDRWARAWGDERRDDVRRVHTWLREHLPADERRTLVHGDFKFNNVMFHPSEPTLIGVFDWELAGIGDPMFDLAHLWCSTWATTPAEYGGVLGVDLDAGHLPSAEDFFAEYYAMSGSTERVLPFHRVLALLRYSGIFWGIYQRALAGTATASNAAEQGATAHVYLDRTLALIDGDEP